ncbi:unannotated protein [freshwater metagenome]|uniref:Unannotated protein n=1 Tax=freshwater metagenome TaxID=449393 RepID=A0A6J7EWD8_9ZZZZ
MKRPSRGRTNGPDVALPPLDPGFVGLAALTDVWGAKVLQPVAGQEAVPASPVTGGSLTGQLYGEKTTFSREPWWGSRGWWKVAESGEANDIRTHVGTVGDLAMAATSLRGNKHRLAGQVNEDSYAVSTITLEDGCQYLVVAVCDGMGSAPYSSFGARLSAHTALALLGEVLRAFPEGYEEVLRSGQTAFLAELTRRVSEYRMHEFDAPPVRHGEIALNDIQSTLTFAIVPSLIGAASAGRRRVTLGIVGDSPAFCLSGAAWTPIEPAKDNGGVWSSATAGLLGATSMVVTGVDLGPGEALLVSSDGIGNFLTFNGLPTALGVDLAHRWSRPVGMLEFVRDVAFEMQSADDDRTALMVWLPGSSS